ncbi:GumC family protein [Litorisediminicola beolgyonensis]|uniref:GumC family protein n=1 Tax=Litorisediminicola beolgyonensis TaxID=1173614 RepID=A0ABW3ZIW4_9RHOB
MPPTPWRDLWRWRWMITGIALVTAILFGGWASLCAPVFEAQAVLLLDPREERVIDAADQLIGDLKLSSAVVESELAVLRAPQLMRDTVASMTPEALAPLAAPRWPSLLGAPPDTITAAAAAERLSRGLVIERQGDGFAIAVRLRSPDPALSAQVANRLAETYIDAQLTERQRRATAATRWLVAQVEERRAQLVAAEGAVERFKRRQLAATGTSVSLLDQQLVELTTARADAQAAIADGEARLAEFAETDAVSSGQAPELAALRAERARLAREDAGLATRFGPSHGERVALASELGRIETEIAAERVRLRESAETDLEIARRREARLATEIADLERAVADMSESALRLRELERVAEAERVGFETVLDRLGRSRAQVEMQRAEARLISPAVPEPSPTGPGAGVLTGVGAALGLSLGLLAALAREALRSGFARASDLEEATGQRVLAVLPRLPLTRPGAITAALAGRGAGLFGERMRQLRAMMPAGPRGRGQVFLVTSAREGEGKTTLALALADVQARTGARVLAVDLDTRRAALISETLGPGAPDLALHLRDTGPLEAALTRPRSAVFDVTGLPFDEGLLSDRLLRDRIAMLLDRLRARYDVVVLDAPPILSVADGLTLAPLCDETLFLVRAEVTPRASVLAALDALAGVGVTPAGLILGSADPAAEPGRYPSDGVEAERWENVA